MASENGTAMIGQPLPSAISNEQPEHIQAPADVLRHNVACGFDGLLSSGGLVLALDAFQALRHAPGLTGMEEITWHGRVFWLRQTKAWEAERFLCLEPYSFALPAGLLCGKCFVVADERWPEDGAPPSSSHLRIALAGCLTTRLCSGGFSLIRRA